MQLVTLPWSEAGSCNRRQPLAAALGKSWNKWSLFDASSLLFLDSLLHCTDSLPVFFFFFSLCTQNLLALFLSQKMLSGKDLVSFTCIFDETIMCCHSQVYIHLKHYHQPWVERHCSLVWEEVEVSKTRWEKFWRAGQ